MTARLVPWETAATRANGVPAPERTRFAIVGGGWRSRIFADLARGRPDLFEVTAVLARRPEAARENVGEGMPIVADLDALLATGPELVVVVVPWPVTPVYIRDLVARGVHVLAETPPAPDTDGLRSLWADVGDSGLVNVAEQYLRMPMNAAALAAVRSGVIGRPTFAHVCSTHEYHAVAMIRGYLGAGLAPVRVRTHRRTAPLVDPIDGAGWRGSLEPRPAETVLATIDVDGGGTGLYEFTDNQWWNPVLPDHLTVRGERGELHDDVVVRMLDATTVGRSRLERSFTGRGLNLEGADPTTITLDGQVLHRNRFEGGRFTDDEIAVAELVADAGAWVRHGGEGPYPLAQACHDHAIARAIRRSTGDPVTVDDEPWML